MRADNFFAEYDWQTVLGMNPKAAPDKELIKKYHQILSPDFPPFLEKYIELPLMQRLGGVGLLCGTDWTALYQNRFFYSRLDHSIGVALIVWHFTRDKAQTLAALLHDVSTPVFSHVSDFRKGDALTQTATEAPNALLIKNDKKLLSLLEEDGLTVEQVQDYHIYPVCDNEIPSLSADRLEYMFPSGMALEGSWTLPEIKEAYSDLVLLKNEEGIEELGFKTVKIAENYCRRFCMTGHVLQLNENKLTLQLLGQIMNRAVEEGSLFEEDFMQLSEKQILEKLEKNASPSLMRLYKTFRTMTKIEHRSSPLPSDEYFCVSLKVKQRYINPLVAEPVLSEVSATQNLTVLSKVWKQKKAVRLTKVSPFAKQLVQDFLDYEDTPYGCVKLSF